MTWETQYLALVEDILRNGDPREDRTGVGTIALFGKTLDIDLKEGFPLTTTKRTAWNMIKSELLWFISGSSNERDLAQLTHGTKDPSKTTIWSQNAEAEYWTPRAKFKGDLGRVYGVQWRHWKKYTGKYIPNIDAPPFTGYYSDTEFEVSEVDQLEQLVDKLQHNPTDRRMILSAWNVGELEQMALPPCHMLAQFFVRKGHYLSCQMYQRSVDTMLGLPFNIASYALLTHMLAHVTGMEVDRLILNLGDVHIYKNHVDGAMIQIEREPLPCPTLELAPEAVDIDGFTPNDITLKGYKSHDAIKMDMAV